MKKIIYPLIITCIAVPIFAVQMTIHLNSGDVDTVMVNNETMIYFSDPDIEVPRLISPVNAAADVSIDPVFSWQYIPGMQTEFLLSSHSDFHDTLIHLKQLDTNAVKLATSLETGKRYNWKVRIHGKEIWSAPWYFTTFSPTPPEMITSFALLSSHTPGNIELRVSDPANIDSFLVVYGHNGLDFPDSAYCDTSDMYIRNLDTDTCLYIMISGTNAGGKGPFSEVLSVSTGTADSAVLIMNGFDRATSDNSRDFIRQHAKAVINSGYPVVSATNEALSDGLISPSSFFSMICILGEESTADETFSNTEQNIIKDYLRSGGNLFVSGAEIAWDLDHRGSSTDKAFCHDFLHMAYAQDAPNNSAGSCYQAAAVPGMLIPDPGSFNFDNGTHGTYNVRYPDVITPLNGAKEFLSYNGCSSGAAGIFYQGLFPGGSEEGKMMLLGFPFETVYPDTTRFILMNHFFKFIQQGLDVGIGTTFPEKFFLYPNYPNPFNPVTQIRFNVGENVQELVHITIYSLNGERIKVLQVNVNRKGNYSMPWNGTDFYGNPLPTGTYVYTIKCGQTILSGKMTLLK